MELHNLVIQRNIPRIRDLILSRSVDLDQVDQCGNTPLHLAVYILDLDLVKFLLQNDADVNMQDHMGNTPLHIASIFNSDPRKYMNLSRYNDVIIDFMYELHDTNYDHTTEIINSLLFMSNDANYNKQNNIGDTPLHIACIEGNKEAFNVILNDDDVDVNIQNNIGNTPLHVFMKKCTSSDLIKILNAGADVKIKNNRGNTALHLSVIFPDNLNVTKLLIKGGSSILLKNKQSKLPIDIARESKNTVAVNMLGTLMNMIALDSRTTTLDLSDYNKHDISIAERSELFNKELGVASFGKFNNPFALSNAFGTGISDNSDNNSSDSSESDSSDNDSVSSDFDSDSD
jgi:ankyrin repeat protein